MGLKIKLNSIMVDNQDKALKFYTEVLGFAKGKDIDVGNGFRWITVVRGGRSPGRGARPGAERKPRGQNVPDCTLPAEASQRPRSRWMIIDAEYRRLKALGVVFTMPPITDWALLSIAVFADTCGNLIQIYQPPS